MKPFLTHCEEIIVGKEHVMENIEKIVSEFHKEKVKTEFFREEANSRVSVAIGEGDDTVSFTTSIEIDENDVLKFSTPYFLSEFDVKVITVTALHKELSHIMNQIIDHYYQLKRLSTISNEENGKYISCLEVVSAFQNVSQYLNYVFHNTPTDETSGEFTFGKASGGDQVDKKMNYRCFSQGEEGESVLFLEVNLG